MPTKSKDLQQRVHGLKEALDAYSFEELSAEEARRLKNRFETFCSELDSRYWGGATSDQQGENASWVEAQKLITSVSHDFRTPLHGIMGFADLLLESELDDQQTSSIRSIRSASKSLLDLINQFLAFSRLNGGIEPYARTAFRPREVLQEAADLVRPILSSRDVRLTYDFNDSIPDTLLGDPAKLTQVLFNLLGNAAKFTRQGQIQLQAGGAVEEKQFVLTVSVRDTGCGIPPEVLPRVFDPYFRGGHSEGSVIPGTGLGLSIVHRIVHQQGGRIKAMSREGRGSTFRFQIPYGIGTATAVPSKEATPSGIEVLKGKRFLVFEDNSLNLKLMETRLKSWGCRFLPAPSGPYGLGLLKEVDVDVVLMDLRMPGMDGYEASRQIRSSEDPRIRNLPIIAVTADFSAEEDQKCKAAGIDDIVLKPFRPETLSAALIKAVAGSQQALTPEPHSHSEDSLSLERLWTECGEDPEVLRELLDLLRANLLEFLGRLKVHMKNPDYREIRNAAHKVKAGLVLINATDWLRAVEEIHELSREQRGLGRIRQWEAELSRDYQVLDFQLEQAFLQLIKRNSR
ncbi:ATP-binding response regulator [Robiginitalea sediminis]|uniref:ATP-binding response regulator n=1 Tax=Robiginitalea sediminis TaxID=1982593 RepID=UPI001179CC38|nr:ATP-binding protein [Robiginitalea sediminis]